MKEQLAQRLDELKSEFENGQRRLAELDNQATTLRQTLLRISGAVQVLEEELSKAEADESAGEEKQAAITAGS